MREIAADVKTKNPVAGFRLMVSAEWSRVAPLFLLAVLVALLPRALLGQTSRHATEAASPRPAGWSDISYYLPMRDGVRVAVSVWFPDGHVPEKPVPTV